jgi:DNA-binding HxlR family transcriptional regulator
MDSNLNQADCPAMEMLALISGRWKLIVLHVLSKQARRFGELHVRVPGISKKVLTEQLRELEADGLVSRTEYKELPPRVEYALTEFGLSLCPLVKYIGAWRKKGEGYLSEDLIQLPD